MNIVKSNRKKTLIKNQSKYKWQAKSNSLGEFDFYNTIITLDAITEDNFKQLDLDKRHLVDVKKGKKSLNLLTYKKLVEIYPLAHHEYTHFIDTTSSLWGLNYLNKMDNAYRLGNTKNRSKEEQYHEAKEFYGLVRSIKLPDYFTQITEDDDQRPWTYRESCGNRFSSSGHVTEHPIFFVTFGNSKGEILVRSPISIISILEASSMAQEILSSLDFISKLDSVAKKAQTRVLSEKIERYIYNKDQTEYSVCAHLISNYQGEPCITKTFKACSLISRLVLNFPIVAFDKIRTNKALGSLLGITNIEYLERIYLGLKYYDIGTLFVIISRMLPANSLGSVASINTGINKVIIDLDLTMEFIQSESNKEANETCTKLKQSNIKSIATLAEAGFENYQSIKWNQIKLPFNSLHLPPVYLGDIEEKLVCSDNDSNKLRKLDLDVLFDELNTGQEWVEKFAEACL